MLLCLVSSLALLAPPHRFQVKQFAAFISGCACVRCKQPLAFDTRKSLQVGVAAQWTAVCTNPACWALPLSLRTSEADVAPFEDDFKLNRKTSYAAITCAVNHIRVNDMLRTIGLGQLTSRAHYRTKEELEAPLAHRVQAKMAAAYEDELLRPRTEQKRTLKIDGSWDHGRNGNTCIMPFMTDSGHIVHLESSRRTEKGVKSSNELERRNFEKALANPRIASPIWESITMDGCQQLVKLTEAADKTAEGDNWHFVKARRKGFSKHRDAFVFRPPVTAVEREAKAATKVEKPAIAAEPPKLSLPSVASPPLAEAQALLRSAGVPKVPSDAAAVSKLHAALVRLPKARAALASLVEAAQEACSDSLGRARFASISQHADSVAGTATSTPDESLKAVKAAYTHAALCSVATMDELTAWKPYGAYVLLQQRAANSRLARASKNKDISQDVKKAGAWEQVSCSMYSYVFAYTEKLIGEVHKTGPRQGELWTDDEREIEAVRLYPDAFLHLAAGMYTADSLVLIGHPATKQKGEAWSWQPPGEGSVIPGSMVWRILEGWVRDPSSLSRFRYYINNRSTAGVESFAGKVHKWNEKRYHYSRYYMLGVHCAVLDHEENVEREILHEQWKRGESLRHKGRFYVKTTRVPTTDRWRSELWVDYEASLCAPGALLPVASFLVDTDGAAAAVEKCEAAAAAAKKRAESADATKALRSSPPATDSATGGLPRAVRPAAPATEAIAVDEPTESTPAEVVASAAAEASAAAMMVQRIGPAAAEETQLALAALTEEKIGRMKVEELKNELKIFALPVDGNKPILAERLMSLLTSRTAPLALEEDGFDDEAAADEAVQGGEGGEGGEAAAGEGGEAGEATAASAPMGALAACLSMGVPPEWFEVACPLCKVRLMSRLATPVTRVKCSSCSGAFAAHNPSAKQPAVPLPRKRRRAPQEQQLFVSAEMKRLKAEQPTLGAKVRLTMSMDTWARRRTAAEDPEGDALTALATAAVASAPAQPRLVSEYNAALGVVSATPVDGTQTLRKAGIAVLGLQVSVGAAIMPPHLAMPKDERPKRAAHKKRKRIAVPLSARTGANGQQHKRQRRRPSDVT